MQTDTVTKSPNDRFNILESLPPLSELSVFCTVDEIDQLIIRLRNEFASLRQQFEDWSADSAELQRGIRTASSADLKRIHTALNLIEQERFSVAGSVEALHSACTCYRNLLAERATELVEQDMLERGLGAPPASYALIGMGSDGREEQTLITDQDYLIVYDDGQGEQADNWFTEFGLRLVEQLETAGFKRCSGDIMTSNPTWRGSFKQWRKRLFAIVRYEVEDFAKNMMDLIVLSDARFVSGDAPLANRLIELIREMEKEHFQVLWGMARAATEMKLALGFMRKLWTEPSGEHRGELNVKLLAWAPLVMNVRILAISQGLQATSTVQRINSLEQSGSFSAEMADGLRRSYNILTYYRIMLQINQINGLQQDSHYLDPMLLDPVEREELRQAVIRVEELQKMIHANFNIV